MGTCSAGCKSDGATFLVVSIMDEMCYARSGLRATRHGRSGSQNYWSYVGYLFQRADFIAWTFLVVYRVCDNV